MNSIKKTERVAGLWYLLTAITSPFGLIYVPNQLIVPGEPTVTANNIMASEILFRLGIVSILIGQISFIFLALALNRLLKDVDENYAKLMVSLVIVAVSIAFINELTQIAVLHLLSGANYLKVFKPDQLNALAMTFLNLHEQGISVVGFFWGLWLFPFGYLVIKSKFIPKVLGILLIIGCFAYLVQSTIALLFPIYNGIVAVMLILPLAAGEISMILWLLLNGLRVRRPAANM